MVFLRKIKSSSLAAHGHGHVLDLLPMGGGSLMDGLTIIDAGQSTMHGVYIISETYVLVYKVFRNVEEFTKIWTG